MAILGRLVDVGPLGWQQFHHLQVALAIGRPLGLEGVCVNASYVSPVPQPKGLRAPFLGHMFAAVQFLQQISEAALNDESQSTKEYAAALNALPKVRPPGPLAEEQEAARAARLREC